jgi:tripartite-type tricarboxylate transporter receptor subunit TctC
METSKSPAAPMPKSGVTESPRSSSPALLGRRGLLAAAAAAAAPALAQEAAYPNRVVRIVVPYPPGGSAEIPARVLAEAITAPMGQPIIVENKPGAGATIATAYVASQPADGYTLLLASTSHTITPSLYPHLPYDAVNSFSPVSLLTSSPLLLLVRPSSGIHSVADLVARAKAKPGELTFSTSGVGASPHLSGEMFRLMAGIDVTHVPYNGSAPAMTAVLGGHVSYGIGDAGAIPVVTAGNLHCLAVTSAQRSPQLPDVPTLAEAGLSGFEVANWAALLAPSGTPAAVVAKLNSTIRAALGSSEVASKLEARGFQVRPTSPEELGAMLVRETQKYADVVKRAEIRPS